MLNQGFVYLFDAANHKLKQPLGIENLNVAISYIASQPVNSCITIQPGDSGYAWSVRKVVMVLLWNKKNHVRIRFVKRNSERSAEITPSSFKELRAFPKGNVMEKLAAWDKVEDGTQVSKKQIEPISKLPKSFYNEEDKKTSEVFYREWNIAELIK